TAQKDAYLQEIQKEAMVEQTEYFKKNPRPEDPKEREEWGKKVQEWANDFRGRLTAKIDERNAAIERDYKIKMRQQQKLAVNFSRVSPASALTFSSMSLARTGVSEHERFLNSVKAYKPIFTKWINQKIGTSQPPEEGQQPKLDLSDMPQHEFTPEVFSDSFTRMLPDFILLVFLIILFFVGAYVSFLRYDVR
ncbi:MAG: DUF3526 domain-containing protein, partial [Candidatus Aminicenantaceae bacterium]